MSVEDVRLNVETKLKSMPIVKNSYEGFISDEKKLKKSGNNVKKFSWQGCTRIALLLDVIDGDSIKVAYIDHNIANMHQIDHKSCVEASIRLYGVDCAELRPKRTDPNREKIISMAQHAKQFVADKLLFDNKRLEFVQLFFVAHGKYGRPMALVLPLKNVSKPFRCNNLRQVWQKSLNLQLIQNGLALPYEGSTRWNFEQMLQHYNSKWEKGGTRTLEPTHPQTNSQFSRRWRRVVAFLCCCRD